MLGLIMRPRFDGTRGVCSSVLYIVGPELSSDGTTKATKTRDASSLGIDH